MSRNGYPSVSQASDALLSAYAELGHKPYVLAKDLGVSSPVAYDAKRGQYWPIWVKRLRVLGIIRPPKKRYRVDIPKDTHKEMEAFVERHPELTMGRLVVGLWELYAALAANPMQWEMVKIFVLGLSPDDQRTKNP